MLEKNRDVILKKARDKYNKPEEKIKKIMYEKNKYRDITDEQKIKEETVKETDIAIWLKKKKKGENMQELDIIRW